MCLAHMVNKISLALKIINEVKHKSLMIAQTPHTFSGIEVALLDLLGKKEQSPIYSLLGYEKTTPKIAYASVLFGKTPQETFNIGKKNGQWTSMKGEDKEENKHDEHTILQIGPVHLKNGLNSLKLFGFDFL